MYDELVPEYRSPQHIPGQAESDPLGSRHFYSQKMRNYTDQAPAQEDSGLQYINDLLQKAIEIERQNQQPVQAPTPQTWAQKIADLADMYKEGLSDFASWRSKQGPDVTKSPLSPENLDALMPLFMGSMGISGPARAAASSLSEAAAPVVSKLKDVGGYVGGKVKELTAPAQETPQLYERVSSPYTLRDVWKALMESGGDEVAGLSSKSGRPRAGGYAEAIAKYVSPDDAAVAQDLALLFRKQPGKAWELVHGEPNLFEMGVKGPRETSSLSREYSVMEPLSKLYDQAYQGASDIGSQIVNNLADMFPTAGRGMSPGLAQLAERGGRYAADAMSSATDALKRAGAIDEATANWYAKTKGTTRKRYIDSGPKNAPEGADLWQRDMLKNMYRDIKPTYQNRYAPTVEEWAPVAKALSPLGAIPFVAPVQMWSDAARLMGLGGDTVSNPDNPGLLESIAYLMGR